MKLDVRERERTGSRETARLRKQGLTPGVLYGRGNPHAFTVPERELRRVLTGEHGLHAILDVALEGQKTTHASILKDYQTDPIRGKITHVDLQEVRLDQPIHASVAVTIVGEAKGVKEGGVLAQPAREVHVEALPLEVPDGFELDVSGLAIGDSLRISDLTAPANVKILDDLETVLATVAAPTRALLSEAEEAAEEAPEAAAGEAEGEAEAAPAEE